MEERRKITKIIDEILVFLFHMGSKNIDINYKDEECYFTVSFKCNYDINKKDLIYTMVKHLNTERQEEMEEYYWELAGKYNKDTELTLVGMMTDDAKVYFDDDKVEILLVRVKR